MPPRIRPSSVQHYSQRPILVAPSPCSRSLQTSNIRPFSSSPHHATRLRQRCYAWLNGPGAVFRNPLPGSTNYLNAYSADGHLLRTQKKKRPADENEDEEQEEDHPRPNVQLQQRAPREETDDLIPFPLNHNFRSQPVLSEELKDEIWKRVMEEKQNIKVVSAELQVEMRRVGAVVRLKAVEKRWIEEGKTLAIPYARAITSMLPQTPFYPSVPVTPHEPINDLPVHRATLPQVFHPVSESCHFTRADAGKVFQRNLLAPEQRIPHPELVDMEKDSLTGEGTRKQRQTAWRDRIDREAAAREQRRKELQAYEDNQVTKVTPGGEHARAEFRFRNVAVVGVGRKTEGVGARYGVPHNDRKRGMIKIPTRVDCV